MGSAHVVRTKTINYNKIKVLKAGTEQYKIAWENLLLLRKQYNELVDNRIRNPKSDSNRFTKKEMLIERQCTALRSSLGINGHGESVICSQCWKKFSATDRSRFQMKAEIFCKDHKGLTPQ